MNKNLMDHCEEAENELVQAKEVLSKAMEYFTSTDPEDRAMLSLYLDTIRILQDAAMHLLCDALQELQEGIKRKQDVVA